MLIEFDERLDEFQVADYSVAITSLEDVFFTLGTDGHKTERENEKDEKTQSGSIYTTDVDVVRQMYSDCERREDGARTGFMTQLG